MNFCVLCPLQLILVKHLGANDLLKMDVLESGALRHFQRLERILGDVKNLSSVHDSPEARKLYELFAEYGGSVHVVLELAKAPDQKTNKVYQALRDIVCARLVRLSFELRELGAASGGDAGIVGGIPNVYMYHDISTQWEQVLKVCPSAYVQTINDHFDDLIRELRTPSPSLERLEVVIRRIRYVLDYKLPTVRGSADGGDGRLLAPLSTPTLTLSPGGNGGTMEGPQSARSLTPTAPSNSYVQFNTPSMANSNSAPAGYPSGSNGSSQVGDRQGGPDDSLAAPNSGDVLGLAGPATGLSGWQDDILRGRVGSSGSGNSMMMGAPGSASSGLGIGGMAGVGMPHLPLGASAALSDSAWLPKSDIPRRPFKSRECDFFKQGKCNKSVCNFAHGTKEKDWWTCKYQAVFPCKTVGCLGRTNGCIYAHNPEEQIYSKVQYEEAVNTATGGLGDTGSYSSYGSGAETPSSMAGSLPSMGARGLDHSMHHIHYSDHHRSNPAHSLHQRDFRERERDYRDYREHDFREIRDPRDRAIGGMTGSAGGHYGSGGGGMGSGMHSGKQWLGKNELPRPFRSKLCEFYLKHGVCTKAVCNYAHDPHEMADWAALFQTMFRCNNKNCVGREGGCTYSHAPEEQLTNKHFYDFKVDKIKQQCHAAASAAGLIGTGVGDNGLGSPPLMMQHSQSHWTPGEVDLLNMRVAQLSMEHM